MPRHLAKRQMIGVGGTVTIKNPDGTAYAGWIQPLLTGFNVGLKATVDKIKNAAANTGSLIITDEHLELSFDYMPQGATLAEATASCWVPEVGATFWIQGLAVVKMGPFADGLNTNGSSTQPWIFEGDNSLDGKYDEKWGGKITLRRYPDIATGVAIV